MTRKVAYLVSEMRDGPIGIALEHDEAVKFAKARGLKQWPRNRGYGGERGFYDIEEVPLVDAQSATDRWKVLEDLDKEGAARRAVGRE